MTAPAVLVDVTVNLSDSCTYCAGRGRASEPLAPELAELTYDGIHAEYRCTTCGSCWYATRYPETPDSPLTPEMETTP